jgi:hypothetical protein
MPKKMAIVCTTIGNGEFLEGYCAEIAREDLRKYVQIYVVPDRKTPKELYERCYHFMEKGFHIECQTIAQQESFLKTVGMDRIVPLDSDNRRNIGYIRALLAGNEVIISIDDDNFIVEGGEFFREHSRVGDLEKLPLRESSSGWYNVCSDLGMPSVYPRGFPYAERKIVDFKEDEQTLFVAVNQGLWTGEPDVDAHTWVGNPTLRVEPGTKVAPFFVGEKSWLPINSQNTAIYPGVMPAYYFIPMLGNVMDRMGDIFQGYFLEACVKACGHGIRIGTPLVDHRRNSHNHAEDMMREWPGITLLKDLLPWLREVRLERHGCSNAYLSLADELEYAVERPEWYWKHDARAYFHRVAFCMRCWVKACKMVG